MKKLFCLGILAFSFAEPALAVGVAQHATIVKMHVRRSIGEVVFLQLSVAPTGSPSCATAAWTWHFSFPTSTEAGKKLLAMLLAAQAQGAPVTIDGTGTCSDYAGVESLDGVVLEQ